jgi:hypothetical protein
MLLAGGVRLFDHLGSETTKLEVVQVVAAPGVTQLKYREVN